MVGAYPPLGFWGPVGLAADTSSGRLAYYREAEMKYGRVCMIASLGFIASERYHPIFGGDIHVLALQALKPVELLYFWPAVLALSGGVELIKGLGRIVATKEEGQVLRDGFIPRDAGYDPLGLKDRWSQEYNMEAKEIAHGRLAMISTLGMIMREIVFPPIRQYGAIR